MENMIGFKQETCTQKNVCFGQGVLAKFLNKNLNEGDDFNAQDFEFVNQLGDSWQRGHLLGIRFGGPAIVKNFLPMTQSTNLYFKAEVENKLALLLDNKFVIDSNISIKTGHNEVYRIVYNILVSKATVNVNGYEIPASFTASITIEDSMRKQVLDEILNEICTPYGITFPFNVTIRTDMD